MLWSLQGPYALSIQHKTYPSEEAVGTWLAYAVFYSGVGAWGVAASYLVGLSGPGKHRPIACLFFTAFPSYISHFLLF